MINPATGSRIKMVSQDAQTGEEVARRDTVKGYEYAKGQYVIITDEDLESVRVESTGLMKVEKFVPAASIEDYDPADLEDRYETRYGPCWTPRSRARASGRRRLRC